MVGSKGKLAAMIMPIMKQAGLVFNVMRNAFTSTHQYAIDKTASAVAHMKYNPAYGGSITDFENTKRDIKLRLQQASQKNFQSLQSLTRFLTNQTRTVAAVGKVGASL